MGRLGEIAGYSRAHPRLTAVWRVVPVIRRPAPTRPTSQEGGALRKRSSTGKLNRPQSRTICSRSGRDMDAGILSDAAAWSFSPRSVNVVHQKSADRSSARGTLLGPRNMSENPYLSTPGSACETNSPGQVGPRASGPAAGSGRPKRGVAGWSAHADDRDRAGCGAAIRRRRGRPL